MDAPVTDLFVYGTLQDPDVLGALLDPCPGLTPVTIPGYRVAPVRGEVYPGLVRDPEATARGHHVRVTADELAVLDAFEAPVYVRQPVATAIVGLAAVRLEAWVVPDDRADHCAPGTWTLDGFRTDPGRAAWLARIRRGVVAPSDTAPTAEPPPATVGRTHLPAVPPAEVAPVAHSPVGHDLPPATSAPGPVVPPPAGPARPGLLARVATAIAGVRARWRGEVSDPSSDGSR